MKKLYSISFAVLLSLSLVSCDKDEKKSDPKPSASTDPRTKFVGTYAGTLICSQSGNIPSNIQIVPGPTQNELDIVGAGIGTIDGNSFTVPEKTTTQSGYTQKTKYSGTINGSTLSFSTTVTVSMMGTTSSNTCTGSLAKQ
jgi:uncharacterized lipoprotein YehR (DUF1307 family)